MNNLFALPVLLAGLLLLSGCERAGDMFKADVWVGFLLVLAIVGGIIWMGSRSGA